MAPPLVVYTDLDGTLLDHDTYDWSPAAPVLDRLRRLRIPVVIVTSKTRVEVERLRRDLDNGDPFIVENGGMTLVPEGYFADGELCSSSPAAALLAVRAGPTREGLAPLLGALRRSGDYRFRSFAELGVDGIVEHTGLTPDAARLANARESSEPLLWEDTEAALEAFARALAGEGLSCVRGGRFVHVLGKSDKASAVRDLHQRMESVTGATIERVVLGDGPNDLAMLGEADVAVVIKARHAHPMPLEASGEVLRTRDAGPAGWAEAMLNILWTRGLVTLEDGSAATGGETGG